MEWLEARINLSILRSGKDVSKCSYNQSPITNHQSRAIGRAYFRGERGIPIRASDHKAITTRVYTG